jgi:hypothetical protein
MNTPPSPPPDELFVVFDSQGPYGEPKDTEQEARETCERYSRIAAEPLKPYTFARYKLVSAH